MLLTTITLNEGIEEQEDEKSDLTGKFYPPNIDTDDNTSLASGAARKDSAKRDKVNIFERNDLEATSSIAKDKGISRKSSNAEEGFYDSNFDSSMADEGQKFSSKRLFVTKKREESKHKVS